MLNALLLTLTLGGTPVAALSAGASSAPSAPSASSAAATRAAAPAAAAVAKKTDLRIATLVPEGSVWDKGLRRMEQDVRKATDGSVRFRIYPGGVAGDEPDVLRKMRIGQLQGGVISMAGMGDIDSAIQLFQIPLFFRSDEEALYVLEKMEPVFRGRFEEKGYILVHWGHAGWMNFFSTEPVETVADLRKLKQFVWVGNSGLATWYEEAGLRAVSLAATDMLTGLKTGMIECLPATPLAALSLQWFRTAGHMLDYPVSPLYGGMVLSKRAWKKLSEEEREALLAAGRKAQEYQMTEIPKLEREALEAMKERGLVVTSPAAGRESPAWTALGEFFAERMLAKWAPPEILEQVNTHLADFRAANVERMAGE